MKLRSMASSMDHTATGMTIRNAGSAIRAKRKQADLSLEALAELSGINHGLLSKYENNKVGVSIPVINKIAEALGERTEALACQCLREAYPALAKPRTKIARHFAELLDLLEND